MVFVYTVAVVAGALGLLTWVAVAALSERPGSAVRGPDARLGRTGQDLVTFALGFGLGGMSASFAGWPDLVAAAAAFGGGVALLASGRWLGTTDDS